MLASAARQYRQQQRLTALAVADMRRRKNRGMAAMVDGLTAYQLAAINVALEAGEATLDEQGIDAPPAARIVPESLVSGPGISRLFGQVASDAALDRLVATFVPNAASTATTVDIGRRPAVTGHIRSLNLPSCSRCAILAGRVYRYSQGFQRHPKCDCLMTMTTLAVGRSLVLDPLAALRDGQIRGLSIADRQAIDLGADFGQVVNVRRTAAGLSDGSSVLVRNGRLTPHAIMRVSASKEEALELLRRNGYVTDARRVAPAVSSAPVVQKVEIAPSRDARLRALKVDPDAVKDIDLLPRPATSAEALADSNVEMRDVIGTGGNCQKCTATYELRRRGVDANASLEYEGEWFDNAFGFTYGEGRVRITKPRGKSRGDAVVEYIQNNHPPGSRGSVSGQWADRSYGHIWNWERLDDGSVIFPDAQTGKLWDVAEGNWNRLKPELKIHRIDNRRLTESGQTRKALIPSAEYRQAVDTAKQARAIRQAARAEFDEAELAFELANPRPVRRSLAEVGREQYNADRATYITNMRDWVARKNDAVAKARAKFEAASKDFELTKGKIKTGLAGK